MPSDGVTIRQRAARGLEPGDSFVVRRTFSAAETAAFGELTRDDNPVHHDAAFAAAKGLARPVLHGLLTGSMLCEIGGQIGWLASHMSFAFRRPVYPGDTITCRLTITEVDGAGLRARGRAVYTNQRGETVLEAELRGHLPTAEQRALLGELRARGTDR